MRRNSVLFVNPDYHSSFALRDELRKIGWKADIYVPTGFPERFLFSATDVISGKIHRRVNGFWKIWNSLANFVSFVWLSRRYKFQVHYGALSQPYLNLNPPWARNKEDQGFHFGLWTMRILGKKIAYLPSGCRDEELRSKFELLDKGAVCGNCGFSSRCSDSNILPNLKRVERYADVSLGFGFYETGLPRVRHLKYKSIDLDRWKSEVQSAVHAPQKIRVIHSHALENRNHGGLNIKGTPIIVEVMRKIEQEIQNVEFKELTGLTTSEMLAEQQKADVIIDQIRYGHWGSTGVEALALGKVLVCYVRPSWETNFLSNFPEYKDLPVVNVNENNLYETMYELLSNHSRINELKIRSRAFAESHYDAKKNVFDLIAVLQKL
jgi:glycosyltransferase involved in cell wall biosynthesis